MTPDRPRRDRGPAASVLLAGLCLFWFSDTIADPDIWGHVRFGRDIIRAGTVMRDDPYSYRTSGRIWVNHEWLTEVIFAGIHGVAGPRGLIALKLAIALLIIGLCHAHLRRRGLGPWLSAILLTLISIPFRLGLGTVRPQIFTYLLFLVELLLIEGAAEGRRFGLWVLPILFAVWVNLHGGVLAGAGVLGLWIAARAIGVLWDQGTPPVVRLAGLFHLGLLGAACGLSLLLNPYGASLITFLLRTGTVPRPEITEWTPLGLVSLPGQLFIGLLAIGLFGLVGSRRRRDPASIQILSVTALLPLISNRHYPLFALALIVVGGGHIADAWARRWPRGSGPPRPRRGLMVIACVTALLLIGLSPARFGCIRIEPFYFAFPARAVELLKRGGVRGTMAVPFDWGEYVIWHLGPDVRVSIDGRRETLYSDESYRQSRDLERGTEAWDALLETPPATDLVLAPNGSPTVNLLARTDGWVPLYRDTFCTMFSRRGALDLDRLVRTPVPNLPDNGEGLCFPDPPREPERDASARRAPTLR
jgi:hypothetical protein